MCKHQFVKTRGTKTGAVTYYCLHCPEQRVESVKPITGEFQLTNLQKEIDSKIEFTHVAKFL